MSRITVEMTAQEVGLWRAQQKIIDQQRQLEQGYQRVGQSAGRAGQQSRRAAEEASRIGTLVKSQLLSLAGALGVGGGIAGAVQLMREGFQNSLEIMREITAEAEKAGDEIVAFAALQEGGKKAERVERASALAARYGITSRGEAYDIVQAMQSIVGAPETGTQEEAFQRGMRAAENIFQAKQVGIPLALGKELEVLGISQRQEIGDMLRQAYVGGQVSGRTPEAIAKAAPGLGFFGDKTFGMAFASVLAGTIPEEQIATYMQRGGAALMETSELADWFRQQGVGKGATQRQRLEKLYEQFIQKEGLDKVYQQFIEKEGLDKFIEEYAEKGGLGSEELHVALEQAGLKELRERRAIVNVLPLLDQLKQNQAEIRRRAKPGLLAEERAKIETELPWMKAERELDVLRAKYADEKAFGPAADPALRKARERAVTGLALKRMGAEQGLWFKTIAEEEGGLPQAGFWSEFWAALSARFLPQPTDRPGLPPALGPALFRMELQKQKTDIQRELQATSPEFGRPGLPPTAGLSEQLARLRALESARGPAPSVPSPLVLPEEESWFWGGISRLGTRFVGGESGPQINLRRRPATEPSGMAETVVRVEGGREFAAAAEEIRLVPSELRQAVDEFRAKVDEFGQKVDRMDGGRELLPMGARPGEER